MDKRKLTKAQMAWIALPIAGVITLGGAGVAMASTTPPPSPDTTQGSTSGSTDNSSDGTEKPDTQEKVNYTSSVQLPQDANGKETPDGQEDAALAQAAKVDISAAVNAAGGAVSGGTVIGAELQNESGNVVYKVDVSTDKGTVEVIVDAGNGSVLAQGAAESDNG